MDEITSTKRYSKKADKKKEEGFKESLQYIKYTINQVRHGKFLYVFYLISDIVCLVLANRMAYEIYMSRFARFAYAYDQHLPAVYIMVAVDIFVTIVFNTLNRAPRRRKRKEIFMGAFHVAFSFVGFSTILFSLKIGDEYSRIITYISYTIYFFLYIGSHTLYREIFKAYHKKGKKKVLLLTSDRFIEEGVKNINSLGMDVDYIFMLKNSGDKHSHSFPVIRDIDDAIDVVCWNWVDRIYVYGVDSNTIPWKFQRVCWEMKLMLHLIEFKYKVIELKTVRDENPQYGALSFLERKDDIPFTIRRVFWITETDADLARGHHAHKKNCQLLFCPYGKIDIVLDDGEEVTTVTLDGPNKGLIIMPCMWHEMIWRESGSILCVLASEYYDPDDYIREYDEFKEYWTVNKNREYVLQ